MRINLDKIRRDVPVAVHIPTQEAGDAFLEEMRRVYPKAVASWHRAHFKEYRVRSGGNYYYPRLNTDNPRMTYGDRNTYIELGVTLVDFETVLEEDVVLETASSDQSIDFLFG